MFEQSAAGDERNVIGDWALRGFLGLVFMLAGWDKFDAHSMWPSYFHQLGLGQWFRYFTGVVEIAAAVVVLIPRTAMAGLAVLALTMAGATAANAKVQPANCVLTLPFCLVLVALWFSRRSRL